MARKGTTGQAAKAESDSVFRCCFKAGPFWFIHKDELVSLGESCQFGDEFADGKGLVDIAGHWFCRYHLPFNESDFAAMTQAATALSDKDKARLKSAWSTDRQKAFNQAILKDKVEPARQTQSFCDLTGVVFPGVFETSRETFPAISFALDEAHRGPAILWADFSAALEVLVDELEAKNMDNAAYDQHLE